MEHNTTIINVRGHMIDARHSRVVISGSCDQDNDAAKQKPANTVNMHGGIYINNIEHIDHFHAPTDNSTDQSTSNTQVNAVVAAENADIIKELLPIFCNNHQQAEQFLATIKGAEDTMITDTVKRLVGQGIINERACKSPLFYILKNHDLYHASLSTWNKQV